MSEEVTEYVFRKRMMELGFASLRTRTGARVDMQSDYWLRQKERFILQLSWALEKERNGEAVVFFMDESFVQVRHQRSRSIVSLGDDRDVHQLRRGGLRALVRSGTGRGTLLIVVHCISRGGLLVARDKDGKELDTAQQIYQSGTTASYEHTSKEDDREQYHKHWNSDSMLQWARNQFFPTARRVYGRLKRFILVLDNSGNHTARPDGYVSASKSSTKPELADALRGGGVKELEVDRWVTPVARADTRAAKRKGVVAPASVAPVLHRKRIAHDKWCQLPAHGGVSQEEMIASLKDLYRLKPELEESQLSRLFREGGPPEAGHELIPNFHTLLWTVPYCSDVNPIETQWAVGENYVAKGHTNTQSPASLKAAMINGLNGDGKGHDGVTVSSCSGAINHTIKVLNQWIGHLPLIQQLFGAAYDSSKHGIEQLTDPMRAAYGSVVEAHRRTRGGAGGDHSTGDESSDDDDDPVSEAVIPASAVVPADEAAR